MKEVDLVWHEKVPEMCPKCDCLWMDSKPEYHKTQILWNFKIEYYYPERITYKHPCGFSIYVRPADYKKEEISETKI